MFRDVWIMTDYSQLSNAELRKRIAEALGYEQYSLSRYGDSWKLPSGEVVTTLPDWTLFIEDAYELEESIHIAERPIYTYKLSQIVGGAKTIADYDWSLIHATARQKSEAWLAWYDKSKILS
jgi:hypothetical protein